MRLLVVLFLLGLAGPVAAQSATVAAAADLQYALDSLAGLYNRQHPGQRVAVVYGSSGKFYEQLTHAAPFDVFFSADSDYPRRLQQAGLAAGAPVPYARGRLVLWSRKLDPAAQGIRTLLLPQVRRVALANPAHAPYGRKAEEVLRHYQLYDQVKPKLVLGENIGQAAQYAATGAADVGVLAYALALSPALRRAGRYWLVPASAHAPLQQSYVVLKRAQANATARAFAAFVGSPAGRAVLARYGFAP